MPDPRTVTRSYSTPDAQLSKLPLGPSAPLASESRKTFGPPASRPLAKSFMPFSAAHLWTSTCWPSTRKLCRRYPAGSETGSRLSDWAMVTRRARGPTRTAEPAKWRATTPFTQASSTWSSDTAVHAWFSSLGLPWSQSLSRSRSSSPICVSGSPETTRATVPPP